MPPISAKRKIDAVLTVCQNNDSRTVEITDANRAAYRLIGADSESLPHSSFTKILPEDLKETIESMVEFDALGGRDLASVLRKMLHFSIKRADGNVVPVSLKVFYVLSEDTNPCYELLMRDITLIKELEALKKQSLENQAHLHNIDKNTGLSGLETLKESLGLLSGFMHKSGNIEATFTAVEIDQIDRLTKKYGDSTAQNLIKQAGENLRKACRAEDTVALIDDRTIGLILLDCNHDDAMQVLNRYRLKINNTGVSPTAEKPDNIIHITASFGFKEIKSGDNIDSLVSTSLAELAKAKEQGGDRVFGQ